jgi:hypothetical protein
MTEGGELLGENELIDDIVLRNEESQRTAWRGLGGRRRC